MSRRPKQVSLFFDAAHSMSLEVIDILQFMSSISVHSTATMKYWMKKTMNATFGIDKRRVGSGRFSPDVSASRKSDRSFIGVVLPDLFSVI